MGINLYICIYIRLFAVKFLERSDKKNLSFMSNFLTPLSAGITRVLVFMNGRLPPRRIRLSPQLLVSKSIGGVVQKRPRPYQGSSVRYVYLFIICGQQIFVWVSIVFMCFNARLRGHVPYIQPVSPKSSLKMLWIQVKFYEIRRSFEYSLTLGQVQRKFKLVKRRAVYYQNVIPPSLLNCECSQA